MNRDQMLSFRFLRVVQSSMSKLRIALFATVALPVVFGLVHITHVRAQSTPETSTQSIADTWQGTLHAGRICGPWSRSQRRTLGDTKQFFTASTRVELLPVTKITLEGTTVKMSLTMIGGSYEGS